MSAQSQPESVDYTGATLSVGQRVTFIEQDQDYPGQQRLYSGELKLIGKEQLVIASGDRLFIVTGREVLRPASYRFSSVMGLPHTPTE